MILVCIVFDVISVLFIVIKSIYDLLKKYLVNKKVADKNSGKEEDKIQYSGILPQYWASTSQPDFIEPKNKKKINSKDQK